MVEEIIYREEQRFSVWLRWPLVLFMIIPVLIAFFPLKEALSGQGEPIVLPIIVVIAVVICVLIGIGALLFIMKLETEVRPDGLYVRFFPLHIRFKRFAAEDLSENYARTYRPIVEYGGWGVRYSLGKGRAYNVSGNKGVQLVFGNGKRLLIGSQRSEELEKAIRSIKE